MALMSHWPKSSRREAGRIQVVDGGNCGSQGTGLREPPLDCDLSKCLCGSRAAPLPLNCALSKICKPSCVCLQTHHSGLHVPAHPAVWLCCPHQLHFLPFTAESIRSPFRRAWLSFSLHFSVCARETLPFFFSPRPHLKLSEWQQSYLAFSLD